MDTEGVWENPLEGLPMEARLCRVVTAAAELEAEGQGPTQRAIADKLGCSTQWSLIDPDLRFAREGFADGRPLTDKRPLLESSGPFKGTARGNAVHKVTVAGREYLTKCDSDR